MLIRALRRPALAAAGLLLTLAACQDDPTGPSGGIHGDASVESGEVSAAAAFTGNIRIGVVQSAASVAIGSDAPWTIRDKETGAVVMTGAGGAATVTLENTQVITTRYRLQVMCSSTAAVNARKAAAEAQGVATMTEPVPASNCTRLFLGDFPSNAGFTVRNNFRNQMLAAGLAGNDSFWKLVTTVTGSTLYRVARGGDVAHATNPVVLTSASGIVTIAGAPYRGVAEVRQNAAGQLAGVNELHIEEYLKGVVPRELPPVPYGEMEAQKAQAVAARTYARSGIGKRNSEGGYDLRATTVDQVYGGYAAEHPVSSQAVDETAGIVATYQGNLIEALFSSTSGGHTASNEEVYASAPIPYLRGVPDAERGQAMEHVPSLEVFKMHGNPRSLRNAKEGDWESDWSRYHRWSFQWTPAEISEVVSLHAGQPVGKVLAINVLERGPSGRVLRIEYVTEAGSFYDTKDHIRTSLKFVNADGSFSSLLSTLFFIEPVLDRRTGEVEGFAAYGGGWGHGVGLSQTGAVGMAEKKHTFEEILRHFYQGIALEKQW